MGEQTYPKQMKPLVADFNRRSLSDSYHVADNEREQEFQRVKCLVGFKPGSDEPMIFQLGDEGFIAKYLLTIMVAMPEGEPVDMHYLEYVPPKPNPQQTMEETFMSQDTYSEVKEDASVDPQVGALEQPQTALPDPNVVEATWTEETQEQAPPVDTDQPGDDPDIDGSSPGDEPHDGDGQDADATVEPVDGGAADPVDDTPPDPDANDPHEIEGDTPVDDAKPKSKKK